MVVEGHGRHEWRCDVFLKKRRERGIAWNIKAARRGIGAGPTEVSAGVPAGNVFLDFLHTLKKI